MTVGTRRLTSHEFAIGGESSWLITGSLKRSSKKETRACVVRLNGDRSTKRFSRAARVAGSVKRATQSELRVEVKRSYACCLLRCPKRGGVIAFHRLDNREQDQRIGYPLLTRRGVTFNAFRCFHGRASKRLSFGNMMQIEVGQCGSVKRGTLARLLFKECVEENQCFFVTSCADKRIGHSARFRARGFLRLCAAHACGQFRDPRRADVSLLRGHTANR